MSKIVKMKVRSVKKWKPNITREGFDINIKEINLKDRVDHKLNEIICGFSKD